MKNQDLNKNSPQPNVEFIEISGNPIAFRYHTAKEKLGFFWLGGYLSHMLGTKACFLQRLAEKTKRPYLRFDYSGHGESGGDFQQGTISVWLEQSLTLYEKFAQTPQILIGSSMGGWLALRLCQELAKKGKAPHALILIAPAPDFTQKLIEPNLTAMQRQMLKEQGFFSQSSSYDRDGVIFTQNLIEDGRKHSVLNEICTLDCPIYILQGMQDSSVPYTHSLELMEYLPLQNVTLSLIHDGDHNLSRVQDLLLLEKIIHLACEYPPPARKG